MIDTHCHLNFEAFAHDWREAADRAVARGVTKMIVVGSDSETSKKAVELAQLHPALYAAVGVHPHHARQIKDHRLQITDVVKEIAELARQPRVVAIGEIGLDYHVFKQSKYPKGLLDITPELKEVQRQLFKEQLQLAMKLNKPVILHSRETKEEVLELMPKDIRGVLHCFQGSKGYAKRIIDAGLYLGFDGDITYVPDRLGVAARIPLERLLLETDSPLITPEPLRGQRNEPTNIKIIAQAHAEARKISMEEIDKLTTENAESLFRFEA